MQIFIIHSLNTPTLISLNKKDLRYLKLQKDEALLLFGGKEMLKYYNEEHLSKKDKAKLQNHPNLTKNNDFKISRSLQRFFKRYYTYKHQTLFYSLSHSQNHAIIAISTQHIGIDLEALKQRNYNAQIDFCFNKTERKIIQRSQNPLLDFYKIWTLKEAQIKLYNLGFYALNDMGVEQQCSCFTGILSANSMEFIYTLTHKKHYN